MRTLHTPRLTLEPQCAEHAEEMFAVLSDPAIYRYENQPPVSVQALRERYARLESRRSDDGSQQWLNWVLRLESAQLIGYVQATIDPGARAAIGYEMASAYWGRGLAFEAAQAMIAELVHHYRVSRLVAVLKRANTRSLRLLERLDFTPATAPSAWHGVDDDERMMCRELAQREP